MSAKRIGIFGVLVLLCALSAVYVLFRRDGVTVENHAAEPDHVVRVLCCYELKEQQDLLVSLAEEFAQREPGIRVELEFIEGENLKREVCLRVEDKKKLDVVICSSQEMPGLMDMGVLADITEDLPQNFRESLIDPALWKSAMDDGRYYGVPFLCSPWVLFCNTEFLKRSGQEPPRDWDELFSVCGNTVRNGIYGVSLGVRRSGDAAALFDCIMYACGGNYYSITKESGCRVLEILDTLKKWGYTDKNGINSTPKDAARDFAEGHAAMLIAPLSIDIWLKNCGQGISYSIQGMPGDLRSGHVWMGDNIGLLKDADEEAKHFVQYLYEPETRIRIVEETGTFPLSVDERDGVELAEDVRRLADEFGRQASMPGNYDSWFEVSGVLAESVWELLTRRNIDIEAYAARLQDEVRVAVMNN